VLIEPAKVLFLNNAINHGVFGPIGVAEAAQTGKSIMFMLESNPGPGLGLLLAFLFFGPRALRPSTPAAMIIHFFGGIHEMYFPYVLMKPRLILAMIAGGAAGVATFMVTGAGLVATPSPGSIFAYVAVTPRGGWLGMIAGILIATAVTFVVAAVLMGFGRGEKEVPGDDPASGTAPEAAEDAEQAKPSEQAEPARAEAQEPERAEAHQPEQTPQSQPRTIAKEA
jgi:PTS system mannitol-specific IIC component